MKGVFGCFFTTAPKQLLVLSARFPARLLEQRLYNSPSLLPQLFRPQFFRITAYDVINQMRVTVNFFVKRKQVINAC